MSNKNKMTLASTCVTKWKAPINKIRVRTAFHSLSIVLHTLKGFRQRRSVRVIIKDSDSIGCRSLRLKQSVFHRRLLFSKVSSDSKIFFFLLFKTLVSVRIPPQPRASSFRQPTAASDFFFFLLLVMIRGLQEKRESNRSGSLKNFRMMK